MHHHPLFARFYDRLIRSADTHGLGDLRDRQLQGLSGRVVEVGAGNAINLLHLPRGVAYAVAVEPEPYLRKRAGETSARASTPSAVVGADGSRLPLADASLDAGITTLALCSVEDPDAAIAELFRVIRPRGELRFLEHVAADTSALSNVQKALDATVWPWFAGGCHTARDTGGALQRGGFEIVHLTSLRVPDAPVPTAPHILGIARRP